MNFLYARVACFSIWVAGGLLGCARLHPQQSLGGKLGSVFVPLSLKSQKMILVADTNRDGMVDNNDIVGKQFANLKHGALLFANNDDSDSDGLPDAEDDIINGSEDLKDLSHVALQVEQQYVGVSQVALNINPEAAPYVRIFYKSEEGWKKLASGEKTVSISSEQIEFALEAKQVVDENWDGSAFLNAILLDYKGSQIEQDSVQFQVSPWIMLSNIAPVQKFFMRDLGDLNSEFIQQIKDVLLPLNVEVQVAPPTDIWQDKWMQDTMEIGYSTVVNSDGPRAVPVVLRGNRADGADLFARTLLAPGFGFFTRGEPRALSDEDRWADWYGNLEVTPALKDYPLGRFYYGNSGTAAMHSAVVSMLNSQKLQGPGVAIDTSWLFIRHVDEIVSFIPGDTDKPLMLITSPGEGIKVLQAAAAEGAGDEEANRGYSTHATVRELLADQQFVAHNVSLQKNKIEPIIEQLMEEFSLDASQVVRIPALMNTEGDSWMPNMVNSQFVNGHILVSNPRGPMVNGVDIMQREFLSRVAASKSVVHFVNDEVYQNGKGNTHCATNAVRRPQRAAFWNQY